MTIAKINYLTNAEPIQTSMGTFLNPYNSKLMNVVTNITKFMTKDTLYVGIKSIRIPIINVFNGVEVEVDETNLQPLHTTTVLGRDVDGGAHIYSIVQKLESLGIELEDGMESSDKDIMKVLNNPKLKNEDFVLDIADLIATFLEQDYQDPASFYISDNFATIKINGKWYFGQVSNDALIVYDFISRQRLQSAIAHLTVDKHDDEDAEYELKPTEVTKSFFDTELPREELLTTEYNPILSSMHIFKFFGDTRFGTNTALDDGTLEEIASLNGLTLC